MGWSSRTKRGRPYRSSSASITLLVASTPYNASWNRSLPRVPQKTGIMIRIRHPQGTASFKVDDSTTTLGELQTYIAEQSGIAAADQELKIGYPPKALQLTSVNSSTLLSFGAVGIRKGEQVIVARKAGSGASATRSATAPSTSSASSSFGVMGGPKPNVSTATGPSSSFGLGARTLQDGLTAPALPPPPRPLRELRRALQTEASRPLSLPLPLHDSLSKWSLTTTRASSTP